MYNMRILLLSHTHCTVGEKKENSALRAEVVGLLLALLNQKLLWEKTCFWLKIVEF